jgi:hypothetical protein
MKKIALIIGVLIAFLLCGSVSAEIDLTTGNEVQIIDAGHSILMTPDAVVAATTTPTLGNTCDVLWDTTHGIYMNYAPAFRYSTLASVLDNQACTITTTSAGVNNAALADYDVLVVNLGSSWNSAYTPDEVNAITSFVNSGKGLLIMGDNTGCPNANIHPVSQVFGTTTGNGDMSDAITNFVAHPITNGISHVSFAAGGTLTATPPSTTVGWDIDGRNAINSVDSKKVVILGDVNLFENSDIGSNDNQKFAENIFNYLCTSEQKPISTPEFPSLFLPAIMIIGFLGAVLLIRRTKGH